MSYCHHCVCETKHILSGWGCILMTTSQSRRCWNTLYMYEEDLLWVWGVCLNHNLQHITSEKPSELPTTTTLPLQEQYQAGAASLWPDVAIVAGWNTFYIYIVDLICVWSVWGVSVIRTKNQQRTLTTRTPLSVSGSIAIRLELHAYDH
jgi:hypothetical protein